jgi:hypothetical protein
LGLDYPIPRGLPQVKSPAETEPERFDRTRIPKKRPADLTARPLRHTFLSQAVWDILAATTSNRADREFWIHEDLFILERANPS